MSNMRSLLRGALGAFAVMLFAVMGCASGTTGPTPPDGGSARRILFIGNSLTYYNDLPGMVKTLAHEAGVDLTVESVTFPGVSLQDHWGMGTALERLQDTTWDLVIMQQGPSGAPESRELLIQSVQLFDTPIRAAGARPAVYMVWPESVRQTAFDSVANNYTAAADTVDAMLFPGIRTWQAAWNRVPSMELYGKDGFHPSPLGTYAIAVLMVHQITGKRAVGLPYVFQTDEIVFSTSAGVARNIQEAAEEAAAAYGRE